MKQSSEQHERILPKEESSEKEKSSSNNMDGIETSSSSWFGTSLKLAAAGGMICWIALASGGSATMQPLHGLFSPEADDYLNTDNNSIASDHRRLQETKKGTLPSYMKPLADDLDARKKLFDETPPEEVKYWFEYTGKLQKYFYRFSKSRGKADYFEGRDDSGVVSARYIPDAGGTEEYQEFYLKNGKDAVKDSERAAHLRLYENCLAMGNPTRPDTSQGTVWSDWYQKQGNFAGIKDRCRVLFAINTVGAGRGTTMLWETPPPLKNSEGPSFWTSEQETAATHLKRQLQEIDALCQTGLIAARVQILVCEPISSQWSDWMDSQLPHCGGKRWPLHTKVSEKDKYPLKDSPLEDRPSPVQVVVMSSPSSVVVGSSNVDSCHDLKSGFMEQRMQDLILAPPNAKSAKEASMDKNDLFLKSTRRDLVSSDNHDVYVATRWSSLVTVRAIHAFLQASADMAAAASSPANNEPHPKKPPTVVQAAPTSNFLIPSFVRVSYVSEENSKVAKWRMHGDFFHPAAWEICKDSFDVTWIPHSLSAINDQKGVLGICDSEVRSMTAAAGEDCGQWWVFFQELQMPTSPEVYANEITPPPVQGGSNFVWMVTERQRHEIVKGMVCRSQKQTDDCPEVPQAVIPLGDLESFLINFTPNTALGKKHVKGRRPGYSHEEEREQDRKRVQDRNQLHGQEEIEKALFDYTVYPAALFRKDATIKAARSRDQVHLDLKGKDAASSEDSEEYVLGPQILKSGYYDITITKPRPPVLGWCQAIARRGLCTLYADYFRSGQDDRCSEACGLDRDWSKIDDVSE